MSYNDPLIALFEANRSPEVAGPMAAYMKNQFPYLGLKRPVRDELQKAFFKESGLPPVQDAEAITRELWQKPEREYQYFALDLLVKLKNKLPRESMTLFQEMIVIKSWWDTVDLIASKLVGNQVQRFPEFESLMEDWSTGENMWLRRTALLYQLKYKQKTNTKQLARFIESNLGSKEFFINKAIGWILREYGKTNPEFVSRFVEEHPNLSNLSKKEALRILNA
ncbi:MAG: DNA alkylation repair protein [Flavobacteriales bacterium]|nr:DNA alkylation repair protein [Flavobacteriales bacterium]